ncbi:hypothetical protein HOG48_00010 [Candidatus Peregrinibacteria bacterium]|jgi:hypothetical protein|nr:hypothetical protein [Candidatus Peregrinibacteria bacterium]
MAKLRLADSSSGAEADDLTSREALLQYGDFLEPSNVPGMQSVETLGELVNELLMLLTHGGGIDYRAKEGSPVSEVEVQMPITREVRFICLGLTYFIQHLLGVKVERWRYGSEGLEMIDVGATKRRDVPRVERMITELEGFVAKVSNACGTAKPLSTTEYEHKIYDQVMRWEFKQDPIFAERMKLLCAGASNRDVIELNDDSAQGYNAVTFFNLLELILRKAKNPDEGGNTTTRATTTLIREMEVLRVRLTEDLVAGPGATPRTVEQGQKAIDPEASLPGQVVIVPLVGDTLSVESVERTGELPAEVDLQIDTGYDLEIEDEPSMEFPPVDTGETTVFG